MAGREDGVREHPARAGFLVQLLARVELHLVGEEGELLVHRVGAADARDLGVAVEEDLLHVVREHQVVDGLRLAHQRRVPARLAHRLALRDEGADRRAFAQEVRVHVHHELVLQVVGASLRDVEVGWLAFQHFVNRLPALGVDFVHRREGRGHAAGGLEELAPAHAVLLRHARADVLHAHFEFLLLRALRLRHVLVARDELHRDRRREQRFGAGQLLEFLGGQHGGLLL